jgi:4-hydroxythreonine-4-phosphate dehydrogenase
MGDAAGIGPEIVVKCLTAPELTAVCSPVIIGDINVLGYYRDRLAPEITLAPLDETGEGQFPVVDPGPPAWAGEPLLGKADERCGAASVAYIEKAVEMIKAGEADGMVTAPINKAAIRMAKSPFPGHTEMLAHLTDTGEYAMMLVGGTLRVSLATIHIPLARVPEELTREGLSTIIRLTHEAVIMMGISKPRIAVCGLNPHAGEEGLFGLEEQEIISPAVQESLNKGLNVFGPLPADTVFHQAVTGAYDGVVAMYHDQGLGPLKTLYFDKGVNVTLGLPIVRTSVDHGTAYDIAGRGIAGPESMIEAVKLAALMAPRRRR